ncbi:MULTISPECIES: ABC transporter ATP-binding protein [Hyphomicrobiales]|uniref:ABC transporter ATP-binding protein n=1 Tax=Hyphomicrobiales TaxID=356 RepID=UPI001BCF2DC9|nr:MULTISPECIES: ABC transporter ATP-binding protein [Hyphomicrobiales]MBS7742734.1 ABC transporter ATP-binding protein [Chelatococcus sp. HY11]CAH1654841.1 High-affinity branched-chain amino acid transport ATP-binding protein LivF [Hyphomicrobiales bacterium]MBX3491230.1 ABC transporter ATP-binding protein [Parvibaculum sp.]MBX3491272.1 ABC transporter ATP-binding protein [Parvibaculum sp.]MBX3542148.1 ABC transporter ATP-binding protein [Chelatococcus sp.]
MNTILEIRDLHAGYNQAAVLEGISLSVSDGEIVSIVGANGAGKSTLLGAITRLVEVTRGSIHFDGTDITTIAPHRLPAMGLVMVPEGGRLFPFMTVQENLELGYFARRSRQDAKDRLEEVISLFPVLAERREQLAGHLSGGERQMCAIARAVMSRPKLLMLDEPSVGLSPMMVGKVFELVEALARHEGLSIVLVEQNVEEALELSKRAYVVEHGRIVRSGSSDDLRNDPALQAAYMGA